MARTKMNKFVNSFKRFFIKNRKTENIKTKENKSIRNISRERKPKISKGYSYHVKPKQNHFIGGLKSAASSDQSIFEPKHKKFKGYLRSA